MCYLCRADHDPLRCPLADICYNCWHRGHQSKDCDARRNYHQDCEYCDGRHSTMECAALWRHYAYSAVSGAARRPTDQLDISCFECGEHGHFGDDCNRRSGRRRTDSAFNAAAVEEEFRFERNRSQGVYYPPRRTSRSRSPGGPKARQGRTAPPPPQTHKRFRSESISSSHSSSSRSRSRSRSYSRSRSRSRSLSRSPPPRSRHDRPHMTPRTPQSSDLRSALKRGSQHGRYEDEGDDYYQTPTRGGTRTPPSRYRDGPQNGRRLQSSGNSYEDLRSSLGSSGGRHDERRGNGGQHTPLSDRMRDRLRDHRSPSPLRPYSERHQQVQKQKQKSHAPRYRGSYDGSSSSRR
ncbi:hypothetical protein DFS34DRAFT_381033 [Phlyctochytrium arcticum]|nr:hypothetical protein DFS34DRAFT_381033 [Phlyctochytrium arcticum]